MLTTEELKEKLYILESELLSKEGQYERTIENVNKKRTEFFELNENLENENELADELKKLSFSNFILKLNGKYKEKEAEEVNKIYNMTLSLKSLENILKNEEENAQVLKNEIETIKKEIVLLNKNEKYSSKSIDLSMSDKEKRKIDIDNKIKDIRRIYDLGKELITFINQSLDKYSFARSVTNYDLITHHSKFNKIMRYKNMDEAEDSLKTLDFKLDMFIKELKNINIDMAYSLDDYSLSLRTIDYLFNNIFADIKIRSKIDYEQKSLEKLKTEVHNILKILSSKKSILIEKSTLIEKSNSISSKSNESP